MHQYKFKKIYMPCQLFKVRRDDVEKQSQADEDTEEASMLAAGDCTGGEDKQPGDAAATEEAGKQTEKAEQVPQADTRYWTARQYGRETVHSWTAPDIGRKRTRWKLNRLKNKKKAALAAVTKTRNELGKLMMRDENLHEVNTAFEKYTEVCETYHDLHLPMYSTL